MSDTLQRTFVAVKPDGVNRGLVGEIISRFERKGFNLIGLKLLHVTPELAAKHYEEHFGKPFYDGLIKFITDGPVVAMVIEGINVIEVSRKMMGATNPQEAAVGTIRGDFGQIKQNNLIHGSDSEASAEREISIYFKPEELVTPKKNTCFEFIDRFCD